MRDREATIEVSSGTGMLISAGAGDIIGVRGLVIQGGVFGPFGIRFFTGAALHVQNCVIRNFEIAGSIGILVFPSGNSRFFLSDTLVYNNGSVPDSGGIFIQPQTAAGTV